MKITLKYISLVLVLCVIGFYLSNYFFELCNIQLNNNNIEAIHLKIAGQLIRRLQFALLIGCIPILFFFVNKWAKLNSITQKVAVYLIIVFTGIIFWQYRILNLTEIINTTPDLGINTSVDIDRLNIEIYLLIGLFLGAILSILIFRLINKNLSSKK